MICELCEKNEGITNSGYVKDDDGDGLWVCYECEQEAMMEFEQQADDIYHHTIYGNITCIECKKENLKPGEYVVWTPDGSKSYVICNACDREATRLMREMDKEEDRRYP